MEEFIAAECARRGIEEEAIPDDGVGFEAYCRRTLEAEGWKVANTPPTGDQGVDLIATLGQAIVAIQCKRYSKPVGNKAVQEVIAGRTHYGAHLAAVVSTAPYTKGAEQLAKTNGVFLLHPVDLPELVNFIPFFDSESRESEDFGR